jgi:hypothetical protein
MDRKSIARLLCLVLLAGLSLSAQPYVLKTTIPFQFEVSNMVLPAGDYNMERMRDSVYLAILWQDHFVAKAILATYPITVTDPSKKVTSQLVFRRYGNGADARYFLSEVWTDAQGSRLHKSRTEREAETAILVAGGKPETVVIYARR